MRCMESLILEKVNGGLLFLYGSETKREFGQNLEAFLAELYGNVQFSILGTCEADGAHEVVYSTVGSLQRFEGSRVACEGLEERLESGSNVAVCGVIRLPGDSELDCVQVHSGMLMEYGGRKLGKIVFHDNLRALKHDCGAGVDEYILNQVVASYYNVWVRDALGEQLDWNVAKLEGIREISGALGLFDLGQLLSHLMSVYVRLTEAQVGSIVLEGDIADDVEWGLSGEVLDKLRWRDGRGIRNVVMESREPLLVRGYAGDTRFEPIEQVAIESLLCVPLVSKACVLGTVNLVNSSPAKLGMFTERDKDTVVTISSLAASSVENAILHNDLLEKERIKANLQIARDIQQGMYPKCGLTIPGYEMAWVSRSCDETGGDYFDFVGMGDGRSGFVIGDVSGHGIGAALLMAAGRANLRALLSVKTDLKDIIERLNDLLASDMDADRFITLCLAVLNPNTNEVSYVNAGHDPPLVFRSDRGGFELLRSTGMPLGMLAGLPYEVGEVSCLASGDILLLSTDGVWEALSPEGERFGKNRLGQALCESAGGDPKAVIENILGRVELFTKGRPHADDLTLVAVKRVR